MERIIIASSLLFLAVAAFGQFNNILFKNISAPPPGYDTDAQTFFTASSMTNTTVMNAVDGLVKDLKAAGLWSKLRAIYPVASDGVGATRADQHKWNLRNPANTDAAFRLNFVGGWTHAANGMDPNGSTGYANTFFTPSAHLDVNSQSFGVYFEENTSEATMIGVFNTATNGALGFFARFTDNNFYGYVATGNTTGASNTSSIGFFQVSRVNSTQQISVIRGTTTTNTWNSITFANIPLFLGARNTDGSPNQYSGRRISFAYIGDGLTTSELTSLHNIVETYRTNLGTR
jgi:hypothetical protein